MTTICHLRRMAIITSLVLIAAACKKDKGSNTVEISDVRSVGNTKTMMVDYLPGNITLTLLTLTNISSGGGNIRVKLVRDDAAVAATKAKELPANAVTLPNLEFDVPAGGSINVPITINRSNITVDTVWGIGLRIDSAAGATISPDAKSLVVRFDFRNIWDGRYRVTGTMTDIAAPTLTFTEQEVNLVTTSPSNVVMIPKDLGIPGYLILSGGSLSYYGSFGPVFTFNPSTNKITSVTNSYGQPASNTRSAEIDPTGTNSWDPTSKAIIVKFYMKQPNTVVSPPHIRVYFNNTLVYLGPRFSQ